MSATMTMTAPAVEAPATTTSAPAQDFSNLVDVLGNLPMIRRYILINLFFSFTEPKPALPKVTGFLHESLGRLAKAFPYLTGQVVYEGNDEAKNITGTPKVIPLSSEIQLIVKDHRHDKSFPSMPELAAAKYPFSMLDPANLAPPLSISYAFDANHPNGPGKETAPVMMVQANAVRGGLILTIIGNHTQMDGTGFGMVISHLAKACRNEPFTEAELEEATRVRKDVVPLLGPDYKQGPELDDMVVRPRDPKALHPLDTKPDWAYFHFSASSLQALKVLASNQSVTPYISTDDAIAALCWQRLTAARATHSEHLDAAQTTTLARPLSARKCFGLKNYSGQCVDLVYKTLPAVHHQSLGETAGHLREILTHDEEITHHMRAFATVLSRLEDKSKIACGARCNPFNDFVFNSWANMRCCDLGFGKLGRPDAARRPWMPVWPSWCYLMPKEKDGGCAAGFCIGEKDMEALRKDEVFSMFAEYIG